MWLKRMLLVEFVSKSVEDFIRGRLNPKQTYAKTLFESLKAAFSRQKSHQNRSKKQKYSHFFENYKFIEFISFKYLSSNKPNTK